MILQHGQGLMYPNWREADFVRPQIGSTPFNTGGVLDFQSLATFGDHSL